MNVKTHKQLRTEKTIEQYRDDIVNGPVVKTLFRLGLPLMVVQVVNISYNVADAFWLGKYSESAMAVPRQVWPMIMFFTSILFALSSANLAMISQYVGAKKYDEVNVIASKFLTLTVIASLVTASLFYTLRHYVFYYVVRPPPEVLLGVLEYSEVITLDLMLSGVVFTYSTISQAIGDTRLPAIANGVSAVFNAVLDPFIIIGIPPFPRLGVAGAAVATVISRLIGFLVLVFSLRRKYRELRIGLTTRLGRDWIYSNVRIGSPVLLLHISDSMAFMFQNALVNSFGVVATTAFAVGFIIMNIADAVIWGLTMPTAVMIGQNLGAGKLLRARVIAVKSALTVATLTLGGSTVVYLFREPLISAFASSPDVRAEALRFLELFIFTLPFFAILFVGVSVGRGSGHTLVPTILGVLRLWVIRVGVGYLLAYYLGMDTYGIWIAMALSNVICGSASLLWIRYGNWVKPVIE